MRRIAGEGLAGEAVEELVAVEAEGAAEADAAGEGVIAGEGVDGLGGELEEVGDLSGGEELGERRANGWGWRAGGGG